MSGPVFESAQLRRFVRFFLLVAVLLVADAAALVVFAGSGQGETLVALLALASCVVGVLLGMHVWQIEQGMRIDKATADGFAECGQIGMNCSLLTQDVGQGFQNFIHGDARGAAHLFDEVSTRARATALMCRHHASAVEE